MPIIEGWGSPSHVQNVIQKTNEDNRKVKKIDRVVNQVPTPGPKQDKIWA
jgi:hypothetical protein